MASPTPANRRGKVAGVAIGAVLVALVAFQTWRTVESRPEITRESSRAAAERFGIDRANAPAPPFELTALDGSRVSLASSRGQVVFVNFWATWCPPCRDEMPGMLKLGQDLARRYPGKFRMVAVSVDDGMDPVKEFFAAPPYGGPPQGVTVAFDDAQQTVTRSYYCTARGFCPDIKFPETYIVDRSGRLIAYVVGPRDWSDPAAKAFLEALIGS